jgi:hypothetical protein
MGTAKGTTVRKSFWPTTTSLFFTEIFARENSAPFEAGWLRPPTNQELRPGYPGSEDTAAQPLRF